MPCGILGGLGVEVEAEVEVEVKVGGEGKVDVVFFFLKAHQVSLLIVVLGSKD